MPDLAEPPVKPEKSAFERAFDAAGEGEAKLEALAKPEPAKPDAKAEKPPDAAPSKRAPDHVVKKADAEPAEVKPVEVKPPESEIDKIVEPKFKDDDAKKNFAALRAIAKKNEEGMAAAEKKAAELEKRIADAEAKGKDAESLKERLAKLESENAEHLKLVRQANIELDPEFRREFIDGRASKIKRAMEIIEESGGEAKAIETALNLRGRARVEALMEATADLPAFQQTRLGKVIEELTDLDERAAGQRTDPEKYLEQRRREDQEKDARSREEQSVAAKRAWQLAQEDVTGRFPIFQKIDGNDAQNQAVEADLRAAEQGPDDPVSIARSRIIAAGMPRVLGYLQAEREYATGLEKKVADMEAELKGLYGKAPSLRGGGGGESSGKPRGFWAAMNPDGEA